MPCGRRQCLMTQAAQFLGATDKFGPCMLATGGIGSLRDLLAIVGGVVVLLVSWTVERKRRRYAE